MGTVPVEPGSYTVVVAGSPPTRLVESVSVEAGETQQTATLEASVDTDGFWSLDLTATQRRAETALSPCLVDSRSMLHTTSMSTSERTTTTWWTTDPCSEPLGLSEHLVSIVSDEVSPTRRGHHNVYPVEVNPEKTNGGAFIWSRTFLETWSTTEDLFARMRAMASDGEVIVQANHPTGSSGLFSNASYRPSEGRVRSQFRWAGDFEAFEILNDDDYSRVFPYYTDMLNRGSTRHR